MISFEEIRKEFPLSDKCVFLNVANHSPPSRPVRRALESYLDDWDRDNRQGDERVRLANQSFSHLIGAKPEEVGCQPNTSAGLSAIAEALNLKSGMNVVVNDLENPANVYPWSMQRGKGIEVRVVKGVGGEVRLEDLEAVVDDSTKVVAISQVQWLTGARTDLRAVSEIAHEHGAFLVVDGIQAAGALKVDVRRDDVDFYACGSYKWLLGPSGAGFLYLKKELLEKVEPALPGYRGIQKHDLERPVLKRSAERFELGEPSYLSFVGTKAGIDLILKLGPESVEQRVLALSGRLLEGLLELGVEVVSPLGQGQQSGIVSFRTKKVQELFQGLTRRGFTVSLRAAGIRVSPGFYNTGEEVENLLDALKELSG